MTLPSKEKQGVSEKKKKKKKDEMTISLTVQPRIQREKWSLYWKESMMTKTDGLDPVVLKVDEKNTKVTTDVLAREIASYFETNGPNFRF